ncbi:MAG: hypothetical protein V4591_04730 [Bdellovibrionota bacterium]
MKLLDFIVCDDIRLELGNKVTIVGVYGDVIMVEAKNISAISWPIPLKMAVYWRIQLDQDDKNQWPERNFDFELNAFHNSEPLFQFVGKLEEHINKDAQIIGIPFAGAIVGLKSTGVLTFDLIIKSSGKEIKRFTSPYEVVVKTKLQENF